MTLACQSSTICSISEIPQVPSAGDKDGFWNFIGPHGRTFGSVLGTLGLLPNGILQATRRDNCIDWAVYAKA